MKKILITLSVILLLGTTLSTPAFAEDSSNLPLSNKKLFTKMLSGIGIDNPEYEFKMSDIFGSDEKSYGQNLYLSIYQKVAVEPEETALNKVAQIKGLSAEEARAVLNGTLEPLIQAHPKISQEDALRWAEQIRQIYQDSVDTISLEAEAEAETMPTEIFANNDTSDSGFDLVADLNDIERILFIEVQPVDVNQKYSGGQPSQDTKKPQDIAPGPEPSLANPQQETGQMSSPLTSNNSPNSGPKIGPKPFGTLYTPDTAKSDKNAPTASDDQNVTDNACSKDSTLDSAIDQYDQTHETPTPTLSSSSGGTSSTNSNAANKSGGNNSSANETSSSNPDDIFATKDIDNLPNKIEMAPAEEYQQDNLCPDDALFCITVSKHSAKYTTYYPADPCIACHVEKMNEVMKKLNSRNLMPKKLTGNLMEIAKCKKGFTLSNLLNINLITVPMPIKTPEGKEASFGKHIMDEIRYFINNYTLFKTGDDFNKAAEIVDSWSSSATTQEDAYLQIEEMVQASKAQSEINLKVNEAKLESYSQGTFFQDLTRQLEEMNIFFDSFKTLINDTAGVCKNVIEERDYVQ